MAKTWDQYVKEGETEQEAYERWIAENEPTGGNDWQGRPIMPGPPANFGKSKLTEIPKRQNRPNILNMAPAEQDKTRVALSGLVQEEQVPGGANVDWDIFGEELVKAGFPPGIIADAVERAKTDPEFANEILASARRWQEQYKKDPGLKDKLFKGVRGYENTQTSPEEDFPEDFGGDQGAF